MAVSTVELKYRLGAVIRVAGQDNGNGQCCRCFRAGYFGDQGWRTRLCQWPVM